MVPKTERIEMRLEPSIIDQIDDWRAEQDDIPSRSEAIRRLVYRGLGSAGTPPFALDQTQKLMTWLLTKILAKFGDKDDVKDVRLIQEVILGGHFWALEWEMNGVLHHHEDSRHKLGSVVDTLDMWDFIETAYAQLSQDAKDEIEQKAGVFGKDPKFWGFDGNHESEHMSIARFLVEELGRFPRFKGRDFNSHMPTVHTYSKMYELFEPMRKTLIGRNLSVDEMITLLQRG
ncbi:YfbU family protein [Mesorhizobium sp. M8A.F.Ca.ET.165.01.1.1]|uniref:YfbU family protein n=1 Tax=Mesorhizobium sp. M8A.F.Ca.ET.165.01.1.1 TaxID=2563960 RepID=UPI0010937F64|nr:YfbU family protein [Mesorhizobium sp. M8A.F.Ca.ET.165.01.1.1]TGT42612.1 hypothetical protein EN808_12010 [Mesorhizobium sp. M8A.F.Ca.ET.165.01.1.1]